MNGTVDRIAILPFENLTSTTDLDWISRVASAVLAYDLTGPKNLLPIRVESIRDAPLKRAHQIVEGYFANEHGELAFHATTAHQTFKVSAAGTDVVSAMNRLAKNLSPSARSLTGCDASAIRAYAAALEGRPIPDPAAPPSGCVPLYLHSTEVLLARGDREGAIRVCGTTQRLPNLDALDRAQFDFLCALAKGDFPGRLRALQQLATLLPADSELLRNIGELQLANRNFSAAAQSLEAALRSDPEDAQAWNQLGYTRALNHDLAAARQALEQYQKLLPVANSNALDSLGEVSFFLGDFAAAERYFMQAFQSGGNGPPAELVKAAQARMMTGDLTGADRILNTVPNLTPLDRAQWEFVTGRRKGAITALLQQPPNPVVMLQLAVWNAQTGQAPPQPLGNDPLSRVTAALLAGQFNEAMPLLEQLYRAANPAADGQIRTLLAWCYARTGKADAARKLLDLYLIPLASSGDNPVIASLVFPKFIQLRAELLHSDTDQRLARQYAGDLADRNQ